MPKTKKEKHAEPFYIREARSAAEIWRDADTKFELTPTHKKNWKKAVFHAKEIRFWLKRYEDARLAGDAERAEYSVFEISRHKQSLTHCVINGRGTSYEKREGGKTTAQLRRNTWNVWLAKYKEMVRTTKPKPSISEASKIISKELKDTIYKGHEDVIRKRLGKLLK